MTRILYWNVSNFSLKKICDTSGLLQFNESLDRQSHIVREVMGANVPDIFVVIEVFARIKETIIEGTILPEFSNAGKAVRMLLDGIRALYGAQWCLVPPVVMGDFGKRECVAVYYNAATIQFAGPHVWFQQWPGVGRSQPVDANSVANLTNYPVTWQHGLPCPNNPDANWQLNRTSNVVVNAANVPIPEYQFAGQMQYFTVTPATPTPYTYPMANRIYFPDQEHRAPFFTKFIETGGNQRTIKLFAVHTSPAAKVQAVQRLAQPTEITTVNAGEVSVVLGDFNVDTFNTNQAYAYNPLLLANYTIEIDSKDGNGNINAARRPYCQTHLLPTAIATPWNTTGVAAPDPQHNLYPRWGYMGTMGGLLYQTPTDDGSIDNVLTNYGGGAAAGPSANISIVNSVVGKPYNANPAPGGVTAELTGGLAYPTTLANPLPPAGINPTTPAAVFQGWTNYARIRSTSDHLPLVIDI